MKTGHAQNQLWSLAAILLLGVISSAPAQGAPGVVSPFADEETQAPGIRVPGGGIGTVAAVGSVQDAADHIVSLQCAVGGFCWPHGTGCCPTGPNNITGPIGLGLLLAYTQTSDSAHLAAAELGGDYDLTFQYPNGESRFGTFAPYFLWQLSQMTGDSQYENHAATDFFDELTAGTYGPADLDTAGFIAAVQAGRAGLSINLRPWEFHTIVPTATALGNPGQDALFLQGVLDGLNTLDNSNPATAYWDLIGWAGGVRGLAFDGTTSFPAIVSPNHSLINGISTLKDLADGLAAQQNANGSWYWHSNLGSPGVTDEDTQTTAYAIMALVAADPLVSSDYSTEVGDGAMWLRSMMLPNGGFMSYPGGGENIEVEGEALNAIRLAEVCGNGYLDKKEECDDGNNFNGDGCSADCLLQNCGDGIIDPGEQCDDGNTSNGDGCDAVCLRELAGSVPTMGLAGMLVLIAALGLALRLHVRRAQVRKH